MGWFSRWRTAGRHGLGAAVTSIPTGPLVLPVSVPAVDPEVAAALARAQAEAALLPALPLDEVARVLGVEPEAVVPAVAPPSPGFLDSLFGPLDAEDAGARPPGDTTACDAGASTRDGTATGCHTEDAPAPGEMPTAPASGQATTAPAVPAQAEPVSRVHLGFRDGTTTDVDDADQARALEELARELTSLG